jgi:hypothetical protein
LGSKVKGFGWTKFNSIGLRVQAFGFRVYILFGVKCIIRMVGEEFRDGKSEVWGGDYLRIS